MAIPITSKTNTSAPTATYPYGNIEDDTGGGVGTPVSQEVYADFHQFFAKMFDEKISNEVYNVLPDNETNGYQYYEALLNTNTNVVKGQYKSWRNGLLEGCVVYGCEVTDGGGGLLDVAEGVVFIDDDFYYSPASTGNTNPSYIVPDAGKLATITAVDPVSGQFIEINRVTDHISWEDFETDLGGSFLNGYTGSLKVKKFPDGRIVWRGSLSVVSASAELVFSGLQLTDLLPGGSAESGARGTSSDLPRSWRFEGGISSPLSETLSLRLHNGNADTSPPAGIYLTYYNTSEL